MARDSRKPDISGSSLESVVSSDDLLKQAWESMGRTDAGDRIEDVATGSAGRTSTANRVSSLTSMPDARTASAEEIAEMLREETERRQAAERRPPRQTVERPVSRPEPPPPQRPSQPRPRRAEPIQTAPQPSRPQQQQQPTQDEPRRRRRRGIGWLIFAAIWLISSIVGTVLENSDSSPPAVTVEVPDVTSTTLEVSGNAAVVSIRDLEPGTCIESLPLGDVINDVATVPCDEAHQYELYANAVLAGDEFPGEDVFDAAFEVCDPYFESYVGEPYASSEWFVDVITPTQDGWELAKDRSVNCLLYIWDNDAAEVSYVTGSARGSGNTSS